MTEVRSADRHGEGFAFFHWACSELEPDIQGKDREVWVWILRMHWEGDHAR